VDISLRWEGIVSREIKFRAWDEKTLSMYQVGELIERAGVLETGHFDGSGCPKGPVHPIMQYTGLKDRNGVEIYEGDIVFFEGMCPPKLVVDFVEGAFCLNPKLGNGYCIDMTTAYPSIGCQVEVVGNIHESPELMEENNA
jgi:uncharacterized phage protein (TIGR01671 family)